MKFKTLSALFIFCSFVTASASAKEMIPVIEKGKKVTLRYILTVDGNIVDKSVDKEPLEFVYGQKPLMPGFEKALLGLKAGEKKHLTLAPQEAYGPVDPKAVMEVPKANFPAETEIKPGMFFTAHDPQNGDLRGTVKELRGDNVLLDFNHPLAGKSLNFDIEILSVS